MTAILWTLGFFVVIYWTLRMFGPTLFSLAVKGLIRRLNRDMEQQSQQYARHYDPDTASTHVFVDKDVKVTTPRYQAKKKVKSDEIAEDVAYEEVD
ncbi:MAG: hypothetical protein SF053_11200 [Bacteroidia bacterium]|nr:hypothetical protein [Bacteroidia bacterium]